MRALYLFLYPLVVSMHAHEETTTENLRLDDKVELSLLYQFYNIIVHYGWDGENIVGKFSPFRSPPS